MKNILVYMILLSVLTACSEQNISVGEVEVEKNDINESMNNSRMHDLLQRIDPELEGQLGSWVITYDTLRAQVITDENADRMRVIVPIIKVEDVEEGELLRLMQANFDSALDARYSVANGVIWSAFIHPLSILSDEEFVSGLLNFV